MYKFENLDQTLIGMSQAIIKEGSWRDVRGFSCLEIPHPVMIEISNPADRYITIKKRKWNKFLPFAESLWMALGMNDLDSLPGRYVKSLYNFSDNGRTWRAGYGPRIRAFNGIATDYDISDPAHRNVYSGYVNRVDQLKYVVESLKRDINTRQAMISIGDPVKDCFTEKGVLKETKDFPCSRELQFMMVDGKLNLTLYIRSNDILWGLSAVNITNFTIMQEYVARIIGVPVGKYYHVANNLHVYKDHFKTVEDFSTMSLDQYSSRDVSFQYEDNFDDLIDFELMIRRLFDMEKRLYSGECSPEDDILFGNDMLDDWYLVFRKFKDPQLHKTFHSPYLNLLFS